MTTYKTTESQQLWKHFKSKQVILLDAIAPLDETDENAEYHYYTQFVIYGSESEVVSVGWVKIDESEYVGMPNS